MASNKSGLRKRCQRLKTQVTWLGLLASPRRSGSDFNSRQPSQPCGFSQIRSKTTLPKMLGAALRSPWGLWIWSRVSHRSISTEWNSSVLLSFWCFHPVFIRSTGYFLRDGSWSSHHLCEYRPPLSPWTLPGPRRGLCPPPTSEEMSVWLCFSFLGGGGRFVNLNSYLFKWTLSSIWGGIPYFCPLSFCTKRWREMRAEFVQLSELDIL